MELNRTTVEPHISSKNEILAATDEYIRQTVRGRSHSISIARRHFKAGYRAHHKPKLEETYTEAYNKGKREGESAYRIKLQELRDQIRKEETDLFALNRTTMDRNRQVVHENKCITKEFEDLRAENSELRRLNQELMELREGSPKRITADRPEESIGKGQNGFTFGEVIDLLD
ncbi:hypothetical protein CSAL01_03019 [Colletotrichum salicis]|uniref:Uncharacterized protein n=1 Tax=Colletotrichum salicis TaxID=1209931 RepID=A0A135TEB6_9PEZI|nr:hypothetical protein CSAL01_03019 [Colletotrichum salicis]